MLFSADGPFHRPRRLNARPGVESPHSPFERTSDRLTALAAKTLRAPVSLITVINGEQLCLESGHGLLEPWDSLFGDPVPPSSFAQEVVSSGEPVVVGDARGDDPARDPPVASLNVVAYAGLPLRAGDGEVLGVFSVIDHTPREWTSHEIDVLRDLAALAMGEVDRQGGQADEAAGSDHFRRLVEHSLAGVYLVQGDRFLYVNPKLAEIFGYTREEIITRRLPTDLAADEDRPRMKEAIRKRLEGETESAHYTFSGLREDGTRIDVEVLGSRTEIGGEPAVIGTLLDITERKRGEAELRRREAQFRSLLENASDVIHEARADGTIRYISPSVERLLGYKPEELVGRSMHDLVHPADAPEARRTLKEDIQRPGTTRRVGMKLQHKDGSWRHVEVQARTVHDGPDEPVAIVNTHDVTDARRFERALRESEERYRLVARATNSAIRDWNVRSGECRWDGFSSAVLRYAPEEIGTGVEWWYDRIHPDDREMVIQGIQSAIDGIGDSWSEEYRFLRGNGDYADVLDCCHIARDERGIPIRIIGSLVDVSEQKRSAEAQRFLARASNLLGEELDLDATLAALARLTLPTLGDYCLIDLVERKEGKEELRRVGYAHVDPTKEGAFRKDESHTLDADPERHPVIRAVRSQESVLVTTCTDALLETISHDEDHRQKLREMGLCSFMIVPLIAHGRTVGVITLAAGSESRRHYGPRDLLVAENLAHRAALAIEHAQLYSDAHEAARAREEMMAVVSHDLRNPLNTIHMSAGLLLDAGEERRSDNVKSLERIRRASGQMEAMIEDLLDASSIEAGQFSVHPTRREISELVFEARDMLQPLCDEKSIRMECVLDNDVSEVSIDVRQMQRVFSNLVGNAIKFTPEGGTIIIRATERGKDVVLSVSDTGPGIPPDELPHVFDRYWQARDGDRRGSGLGLAIAKGIVEAHGGRIWVESGEGGGTTFFFSIVGTG